MRDKTNWIREKVAKINSISNCFCTAKWLQTSLYLQNGYNHSCHLPSSHKIPLDELQENPAALHNTKYKKEQRKLMLEGIRPQECGYCWKIEDLGKDYLSERHTKTSMSWAWPRFDEISKSDPNADVYPSYLEVSFSNACNLKCGYCNPTQSSKWMEEIKQFGPYNTINSYNNLEFLNKVDKMPYRHNDDNPYVEAFWKWFPEALDHLKVFRITGGEPLMSKDTWRVLEYIKNKNKKDLTLAINTNLVVDDKLIDKLIKEINDVKGSVGKIELYTSLESIGKPAEYVRYGLDFEKWKHNYEKVLQNVDCIIHVMTTINALSLTTFNEFVNMLMNYKIKYNQKYDRVPFSLNIMQYPAFLNCKILPQELREQYAQSILNHGITWLTKLNEDNIPHDSLLVNNFKRFCDYLIKDEDYSEHMQDFKNFITEYDIRRNVNFKETFPELAFLLD